jgi:hypothetical protein
MNATIDYLINDIKVCEELGLKREAAQSRRKLATI